MKINWTPRGRKRFFAISNYIATEFYTDYADAGSSRLFVRRSA